MLKTLRELRLLGLPLYNTVDRVSEDPPFSHTGLDFADPLYINSNGQPEKVYIFLYTCAATHAVHLELL